MRAGGRQQTHDRAADRGLAGSRFADDAEFLAAEAEADAAHGLDAAAAEGDFQIADLEQGLAHSRPPRIEDVAQRVAEQVEGQADDGDGEAGRRDDPGAVDHELAAGGGHRAPFGRRAAARRGRESRGPPR